MQQIGFDIPNADDAPVSTSVLLGLSGVTVRVIANPVGPSELARRAGRHGGSGHASHVDG